VELAILTALITAAAGLGGVGVGGWIAAHGQKKQRQHERAREQLNEFYAPMLGIRSWILAKGQRRVRVSGAADAAWRRLVDTRRAHVDALRELSDERMPDFARIIEDNNRELVEDILPRYHEMVDLFRERMALAEPSTVEHFGALVEFVDLWDRWLDRTIPPEVVTELDHSEEKLAPFYADLAEQVGRLKDELKR
jgi:hypothetical protein